MSERKLFQKVVTEQKVVDAIKAGCQTSRDVADTLKVHHVTIQTKLLEMHEAGYLSRRKIGQTYFYAVAEDVEIPEDTTEEDKAELARMVREAKRPAVKEDDEDESDFFRKIKAAKRK